MTDKDMQRSSQLLRSRSHCMGGPGLDHGPLDPPQLHQAPHGAFCLSKASSLSHKSLLRSRGLLHTGCPVTPQRQRSGSPGPPDT